MPTRSDDDRDQTHPPPTYDLEGTVLAGRALYLERYSCGDGRYDATGYTPRWMLVLYPDRMAEDERERLLDLLREPPIAAEPLRPWPRALVALCLLLPLLAITELAFGWPVRWVGFGGWLRTNALLVTLYVATSVAAFTTLLMHLRSRHRARHALHPCGRFLYPFGYVEARPERVLLVPGPQIGRIGVDIGPAAESGGSRITVIVASGSFRGMVRFRGIDLDVPRERLDDVLRARWQDPDAYRMRGRAPFRSMATTPLRERARLATAAVIGAVALAAASVTWVGVLPGVVLVRTSGGGWGVGPLHELRDAFWLPWVRDATQARLDHEYDRMEARIRYDLREPWASELVAVVARARSGERFAVWTQSGRCDGGVIDQFVRAHSAASDGTVATWAPWDGSHANPEWHRAIAQRLNRVLRSLHSGYELPETIRSTPNVLAWTECTLRPLEVRHADDGRAYVAIAVELRLHLRALDRPAVTQDVVFDHLTDAIPSSTRSPYSDWRNALERAVGDLPWRPAADRRSW